MIARIVCRLLGHKLHTPVVGAYHLVQCERCGAFVGLRLERLERK